MVLVSSAYRLKYFIFFLTLHCLEKVHAFICSFSLYSFVVGVDVFPVALLQAL